MTGGIFIRGAIFLVEGDEPYLWRRRRRYGSRWPWEGMAGAFVLDVKDLTLFRALSLTLSSIFW